LILIRRSAGGFHASFDDQAAPFGDTAATSSLVTLTGTRPGETWTVRGRCDLLGIARWCLGAGLVSEHRC
jgi:hypothetical protein